MSVWLLVFGVVWIGLGVFVLLNRERMLRWSQKHLRRNVGEVGKAFAEAGTPRHMVGPGVGAIVIGTLVVFQAVWH